ncbi:MAG: hypothetical protein JWN46_1489, partial [Acidimicrobiales bacterium]|nr:hypothetical protein [Acidimicrobiales bacterium]
RTLLHQRFTHSIGPDGATLVMSQFPIDEAHEPATKDFVRAEIAGLRGEIGSLRAEMHSLIRQQTMWFVGTTFTSMGVIAAVVHALS